ncbi:MAG: TIGR01777 family oxidoreductase [Pseudomonadota bacterium]
MGDVLWALIGLQMAMGLFDTVIHHELTERLAWRPSQAKELRLHAIRNWFYAVLFAVLGWSEPNGLLAIAVMILLGIELIITLIDFIEEDLSRSLPASERVTHTLLALNYGAILVLLLPVLLDWSMRPTGLMAAYHGVWTWLCSGASVGTILFGIRDMSAAVRAPKLVPVNAKGLVPAPHADKTVLVTGATGFVGRRLVEVLIANGFSVVALVRRPEAAMDLPMPISLVTNLEQIPSATRIDAIVNLAGEPIANGLWTSEKRQRIIESRRDVTRSVIELVKRLDARPEVLVNGSAVGWYGIRGDDELDEASGFEPCFSHDVCAAWEAEAKPARDLGLRVVLLRIGLVLGVEGGVLSRMLTPFEFGLGGRIGSGNQWMSWISRDDLVRLICHAITCEKVSGKLNGTAPKPVRNSEFTRALGRALGRPTVISIPAAPLSSLSGDLGKELLLGGQRVGPLKALSTGFRFEHPDIERAMKALFRTNKDAGNTGRRRADRAEVLT